jgi:LmbE family N-acetylglucosaminyl deacetylase
MIGLSLPPGHLHIVCLAAHPDDIEIGCGGTLLALTEHRPVTVDAFLLTGDAHRVTECQSALADFTTNATVRVHAAGLPDGRLPAHWGEAKEFLEATQLEQVPDLIFAPHRDDSHQDHAVVAQLAATVWRDSMILRYEIPKWDGDLASASTYVQLSEELANRKVALLNKHFGSQTDRDWWDAETFLGILRLRGVECRARYAEGFIVDKTLLGGFESDGR